VVVDNRNEIREFLTSGRARITPEQAGLPAYGGNRRVAGLRPGGGHAAGRGERRLPHPPGAGVATGVSESVLQALAQALRLDEAERAYLFDLARATHPATPARRRRATRQRSGQVRSVSWTR
jgi:hypothetical protein